METTIQGVDWSALREHLPFFALLLFSLPPLSFVMIKVVLASNSASKQKVTKQWFISRQEEEAAKAFYFDASAEEQNAIIDARRHALAQPSRVHAVRNAGRR
jgi:hypothetical protein